MKRIVLLAAAIAVMATPALAWPWDKPKPAEAPATQTPTVAVAEGSFAWLLADCLQQAAEDKLILRQGRYLRFNCWGPEARAIYERLAPGAARGDYLERVEGQRTIRFTDKEGGEGHDSCWSDRGSVPMAEVFGCDFTMPVGAVLDEPAA